MLTQNQEFELFSRLPRSTPKQVRSIEMTLLLAYKPLVQALVRRYAKPRFREDMAQEANLALLTAIRNYTPNRNARFGSYASKRIRGALLEYLIQNNSCTSLGHSKKLKRLFFRARKLVGNQIGIKLIAAELRMSEQQVEQYVHTMVSGDAGIDHIHIPTPSSEDLLMEKQPTLIQQAFNLLDYRTRVILTLVYEGKTLREIGEELNIHYTRVNQIRKRGMENLKSSLEHLNNTPI